MALETIVSIQRGLGVERAAISRLYNQNLETPKKTAVQRLMDALE